MDLLNRCMPVQNGKINLKFKTLHMTPRNLFNIILKILGIFFIKDFLAALPDLMSVIIYFKKPETAGEAIWILITQILILLVYAFVSYYLVFKTSLIIEKLKLEKGFDQEIIPLNIHRSNILRIAVIVIGGYMAATEIPNFCRLLFSWFQERRMTLGQTSASFKPGKRLSYDMNIGVFDKQKVINTVYKENNIIKSKTERPNNIGFRIAVNLSYSFFIPKKSGNRAN